MKTKLLDTWYELCRDAKRQQIVVISLSIVCALFYLISAISFGADSVDSNEVQIEMHSNLLPGLRAVAIQSAGPLPKIKTGDYVDVIIEASVAIEHVEVFDVLDTPNRQTTVVLAVPVTESALVANASSLGLVSLVLVG